MNNSLCTLPVVLQPLCLFAGRVICTTTSHSPNAAGNKGSLFAAADPKDVERDAGGGGEIAVVGDPTQQGLSLGSRGTSRQGGLGTTSQVHLPALFPSPLSLLLIYNDPSSCIRKTTSELGSETEVVIKEKL